MVDKIVIGVIGSLGRVATVVVKEVIKGGLVVYTVTSDLCEATTIHLGNLVEEAEAELEGREPHYKEIPEKEEEELQEVEKVVEEGAVEILETLVL